MKVRTNIFLLVLLALCSCGGGSHSSPSIPPVLLPEEGTQRAESNKVEFDSKDLEEVEVVLAKYSIKWSQLQDSKVDRGVLIGMMLSELRFKGFLLTDARYVDSELEKNNETKDFTETAKQLLIRRSK